MSSDSTDSLSTVIGDMVLIAGSTVYSLPVHEYLQSMQVEVATDGTWFIDLVLFDVREEVEDILLAEGYKGIVQLRWGYDVIGGIAGLPLYTGAVARVRPRFTPQGTQLRIGLIPDVTIRGLVNRKIKWWGPLTPLSDIAGEIAAMRKYKTQDRNGVDTIQPTTSSRPDPVSMMGESDLKFLRDHIAPYAVDDAGRGGFEVYVDESNALHFHNDHFQPNRLAVRYTVYRNPSGQVISFEPIADDLFAAVMGAGNTTYEGTDSDAGTRTEVKTGASSGVPDVQTEVLEGASARYNLGKDAHSRVHLSERDPVLFKARVANQYAQLARLSCNARLIVKGTHDVAVNDFLAIDYYRQNGDKHWLSGNFKVKRIVHQWGPDGWTTDFDLLRDGVSPVPGTVAIDAPVQVTLLPPPTGQQGPQGNAAVDAHTVQPGGGSRR